MSEMKYARIIEAVTAAPWAILPGKLAVIQDLIAFRAAGGKLMADEIRERLGEPPPIIPLVNLANVTQEQIETIKAEWNNYSRPHAVVAISESDQIQIEAVGNGSSVSGGSVAVLPLMGTIMPRANMMSQYSGGTSVQGFTRSFRDALANSQVSSIVIDVDSPGGQVSNVPELAAEILRARGTKPIVAVANTLAASAAYWIASAADELIVSPSAEVGSIGVLAMHKDVSGMLEREGVKMNFISAGKYKVEGNPYEPLTDEARGAIQARVDEYYDMFVSAVAKGRGVKASDVRNGFGEARVVGAREAVSLGMADSVATLDETIARMSRGTRRRGASADLDTRQRRLRLAEMGVSVDTAVSKSDPINL